MSSTTDTVANQIEQMQHDQIELRAYCLWEKRGSPVGSPDEDWLQAELELRGEHPELQEQVQAAQLTSA